jgi:hypothetical protein
MLDSFFGGDGTLSLEMVPIFCGAKNKSLFLLRAEWIIRFMHQPFTID